MRFVDHSLGRHKARPVPTGPPTVGETGAPKLGTWYPKQPTWNAAKCVLFFEKATGNP